jgi:hypothetical protein
MIFIAPERRQIEVHQPVRVAARHGGQALTGHGEWSELGSRDIDHTTRGARVRERDAIESIRAAGSRIG